MIVVVLAIGVVLLVRSPNRSCKGVGIGPAIDAPIQSYPSASAAVDAYVHSGPMSFTPEPVPTDGWHEDGNRWLRDLPGGRQYHVTVVQHVDGGWIVAGDWGICSAA